MNDLDPPDFDDMDDDKFPGNRGLSSGQRAVAFETVPFFTASHQAPPPHPHQQEAFSGRAFSLRDLLVLTFYNAPLIKKCMAGCVALGVVAAVFSHTHYTADSLLLFSGGDTALAGDLGGTGGPAPAVDGLKAVQSEVQLIQSDEVLKRTVDKIGPTILFPSLASGRFFGLLGQPSPDQQEAQAVKKLRDSLRVDAETGTNIIHVSYSSVDRDLAIRAVKNLVSTYMAERQGLYASAGAEALDPQMKEYSDKLKQQEAAIQAVRDKYQVLDITQDISLATDRLDGLLQRENQLQERRTAVHAELTVGESTLKSTPAQVFSNKEVSNNAANDDARNTLLRLQQQRAHMATQYAANWPGLTELDAKIADVKAQLNQSVNNNFFTARTMRNPVVDQLAGRVASLKLEAQSLDNQLEELNQQYASAEKRVTELRDADRQLHDLKRDHELTETVYKQLTMRQASSQLRDAAASGSISLRVVQPATAPMQGRNLALTYLAGGIILGLIASAAAAVVATMMRQVYIMPSEAERDLDMPALAEFNVAGSDFSSAGGQREISNLAAFLLDVSIDNRPLSVVQVVSCSEPEEKVALVRALATELAQGHGLRTLILDLREEDHDGVISPSDARHVSVVEADIPVMATDVPQLWVCSDAARTTIGNSRTLMSRSREMIAGLREHFDMVLVISPSDIAAYGARRLASLVDGNLMVVRSEHSRAPVAAQIRDIILSAGGNLLGFAYTWRRYHIPAVVYKWL